MNLKHLIGATATVATVALLLVGCASTAPTSEPTASATSTEPVTLRVGAIPIANLAPLYVGIDQGFFEEENLTIETVMQGGGAQVVAALVAGDIEVGWSSTPGTIVAAAQGIPIRIVAPGTVGPDDADALNGQPMVVAADSDIQSIDDLEGASIAVNTRANILEITISAALENAGIDPSTISWVEIPTPDMPAALAAGQVDVISASEPFYTLVSSSGDGRAIFDAFYEAAPSLPTGHWVAVDPYASENGDVLARFNRAITKSNTYANEHPDEARAAILEFTEIPSEVVDEINLSTWSDDVDVDGLVKIEKFTRQYGPEGLTKVDVSSLVVE